MKKIRMCLAGILAVLLLSVAAFPAFAAGFDFEKAVEAFVSTPVNTFTMQIGATKKLPPCAWNEVTYYVDGVVTLDEDGTVTAQAEGTGYIAVVASENVYQLYCYRVETTKVTESTTDRSESITNTTTERNKPVVRPDDSTDDFIADKKEEFEKRQEEIHKEAQKRQSDIFESGKFMLMIVLILFVPLLGLSLYSIISMLHLSSTSMKYKELPPRVQTAHTVTAPVPDLQFCPKCGKPFGEATFCSTCGVSKKGKNTYVVPIDKRMTAQKLEQTVNEWLAQNPYIYDCRITLDTKSSLFMPFVGYKFFVKSAVLEYTVADRPQNHRFGLAFIYKFRLFGPLGYNKEKHVGEWNKNNPDSQVISTHGNYIQHLDNKGGFWAQYYNYVFFKR